MSTVAPSYFINQGRNRTRHWIRLAAVVLAVACIVVTYGFRRQLLPLPARFLIVDDALTPSDLILVLNGDPVVRPPQAASLYLRGLAPKIAIARNEDSLLTSLHILPNTTDLSTAVLIKLGVPEANIIELNKPGGVTSTFDEAELLRSYAQTHSVRHVIIVTSAFHTRRARWTFQHVLGSTPVRIQMSAANNAKYSPANWWTLEDGQIAVHDEYVKMAWYLLRYGL